MRPLPAIHWPSVRGRARADAGPLLLTVAVVVVVAVLAAATPPLLRAAGDDAVRDATRRAGADADVLARARFEYDDAIGGRGRDPRLAEDLDAFRSRAADALDPRLRGVMRPPVTAATTPVLKVTDGSLLRTFQLAYLADEGGAYSATRVTWVAGVPPGPNPAAPDAVVPYNGPPWTVQVGLSEAVATALGVGPGDRIPLADEFRRVKDVRVSGVFRAARTADPGWRLAPGLLQPASGTDGVGTTRLGGLLSPDSLPDARLAVDGDEMDRTVRFMPDPDALTTRRAGAIVDILVTLKATSASASVRDTSLRWESQLDFVLRRAILTVDAASAQASVLLLGVLAAAVLVLLVAADLVARRRSPSLTVARQRGAGLTGLGAELLLESVVVAVAAGAVGLALARFVTPGVSGWSAAPVMLAAAVAGPVFGVVAAARATRDRRAPANRSARRHLHRTGVARRATVEVAIVALAVAAVVTLHQRGLLPASAVAAAADGTGTTDTAAATGGPAGGSAGAVLPWSGPALAAVAAALILLRLMPFATGVALRRAVRSRRPLAVFGAARARATSARPLPVLVMVTAAALASFALTVGATADRGLTDETWRAVGADARIDVAPEAVAGTAALADGLAAAPGVRHAVAGQLIDHARVTTDRTLVIARLVIVDSAAFRRMRAQTPLADAPGLARLPGTGGGSVAALVRSGNGTLRPGMRLQLPRDEDDAPTVALTAVGVAPAIGDAGDTVVVDAGAMAAAGVPVVPNTVWVTGPGAARAVTGTDVTGDVVVRADLRRDRRGSPLTAGMFRLIRTAVAVVLVLGLLGAALAAAASAPDRWQTLSRLRTLGLRVREARWVAAGELLPPVAVAAIGGPAIGVLLGYLTLGPLALRLLTGGAGEPPVTVPWWGIGAVAVGFLATVAVVVAVETALRRRRRLADVLRVGG